MLASPELDSSDVCCRDLLEEASGLSWNASLERSHWQISLGEGEAPVRCQTGLWDPDNDAEKRSKPLAEPPGTDGAAAVLEQASRAPILYLSCFDKCHWHLLGSLADSLASHLAEFCSLVSGCQKRLSVRLWLCRG